MKTDRATNKATSCGNMRSIMKSRSGSALVTVLLTLVVVTVLAAAMANLFSGNLSLTKHQERTTQAYYLALTGVELGMAALIQQGVGGETDTLLQQQYSTTAHANVANTPVLTDTLTLDGGRAEISIKAATLNGERWVTIHSVGVLDGNGTSKSTTMRFLVSNPTIQIRTQ